MPLTAKGKKIRNAMYDTYGTKKKVDNVFYAMRNAGKVTGVDRPKKKRKHKAGRGR